MLGNTCIKQKNDRRKSSIHSRSGRTGLEKILIAAVGILLVAGVVCATIIFSLWKTRIPDNGTETTVSAEETTNDAITLSDQTQGSVPGDTTVMTAATTVNTSDTTAAAETTTALTVTVTPAVTSAVPAITNPSNMYSSYAYIKSFDPVTGWASFDYFDMLVGDDAVQWLVDNEGYTQAQAQAEVDGYGDGEFVEKNINPQLRTVDMHLVPIKMMYHPDGTMAEADARVSMTYDEFKALYIAFPDKVMHSFFYYITVEDGVITKVDQVFWV